MCRLRSGKTSKICTMHSAARLRLSTSSPPICRIQNCSRVFAVRLISIHSANWCKSRITYLWTVPWFGTSSPISSTFRCFLSTLSTSIDLHIWARLADRLSGRVPYRLQAADMTSTSHETMIFYDRVGQVPTTNPNVALWTWYDAPSILSQVASKVRDSKDEAKNRSIPQESSTEVPQQNVRKMTLWQTNHTYWSLSTRTRRNFNESHSNKEVVVKRRDS